MTLRKHWQKRAVTKKNRRIARAPRRSRPRLEALETRQLLAADVLQITVENLRPDGGLLQTPFWVAAHDGTFDVGDSGQPAAGFGGLEALAEEGDASGIVTRFAADGNGNDSVITAPDGFAGAPVFEAGEAVTANLNIDDTQIGRFFSFASMIIPSNDAFIANLNEQAYEIFDVGGNFLGDRSIVIYGDDIYDAGTEVNDPAGGAAFSAAGGTATDEGGVIALHTGLGNFVGEDLVNGEMLGSAFRDQTPIARITLSLASNPATSPIDTAQPRVGFDAGSLNEVADFHEFNVFYSDPSGVDITSIDTNDITVTSPFLTTLDVISVTTDAAPGTTPSMVTATYRVAPADGSFNANDNGTYSVRVNDAQVNDTLGNAIGAEGLGTFDIDAPYQLQFTFESLGPNGGLGQTPVWLGVHNGSFEVARAGVAASEFGGLEALAEQGDLAGLGDRFALESNGPGGVITAPDGFADAPVFEPGETESLTLEVHDPISSRFLSYASMIIPSNDAFIANLNSRAYELFDAQGEFLGSRSIVIYGNDIWDAGTEINDPVGGAAFSTGGGVSIDESGVIHRHEGLDDFIGTGLPTGNDLLHAFGENTPIGRLTVSLVEQAAGPIDSKAPLASVDVLDITEPGAASHEVVVVYDDASGVDVGSIDTTDISVVGAFNLPLDVTGVTTEVIAGTSSRTVIATYTIESRNGEFSTRDNGIYQINLNENAVTDVFGNANEFENLAPLEVFLPVQLEITVENLAIDGGLAQTPFWVAVHEGDFQVAQLGSPASDFGGLEAIAETGDASELVARFAAASDGVDGVVLAPEGFAGAPVFEPGEIASQTLNVFNTDQNRYFSFASMIIPSNDAFIGNLNSRAYALFDSDGVFNGSTTITIYGEDIFDAGTEVNDPEGGAAFAVAGGDAVDENGVIVRHDGLDDFIGDGLPTGTNLERAFGDRTPIARITIGLASDSSTPLDVASPVAISEAGAVTTAGTASAIVSVTYSDPSGIDLSSIDANNLLITGPLGSELVVNDAQILSADGDTPRTVTVDYSVTTDDGEFTARNNGRYNIFSTPDGVRDTLGNAPSGDATSAIGQLDVQVGVRIQVEIQTLTEAGGLGQTPFWVGFHDGAFEVARAGSPASDFGGLELIAEEGDVSELVARFAAEGNGSDGVITAPDGFAGAPVFEPGEVSSQIFEVANSELYRYFSFASMIIPSNDAFIANLNSMRYDVFDVNGNFTGAREITIYGRDVLDAGTETNDPLGGAAFSTEGGVSLDENSLIGRHSGLDSFVGTGTPVGDLASAFGPDTPLATITITLVDPPATTCSGVIGACSVSSVQLQNQNVVFDVNDDGNVSPADALAIINFLDEFGIQTTISNEARELGLFLDVGGDERITPSDALLIIDRLDSLARAQGEFVSPAATTDLALSEFLSEDEDDDEEFIQNLSPSELV